MGTPTTKVRPGDEVPPSPRSPEEILRVAREIHAALPVPPEGTELRERVVVAVSLQAYAGLPWEDRAEVAVITHGYEQAGGTCCTPEEARVLSGLLLGHIEIERREAHGSFGAAVSVTGRWRDTAVPVRIVLTPEVAAVATQAGVPTA